LRIKFVGGLVGYHNFEGIKNKVSDRHLIPFCYLYKYEVK